MSDPVKEMEVVGWTTDGINKDHHTSPDEAKVIFGGVTRDSVVSRHVDI
jgi:hypothetical protein